MTVPNDNDAPPKISRARGCLSSLLLASGMLTLFSGALALAITAKQSFWAYEYEVERLTSGNSTSSSFHGGIETSPLTLSIWLMAGSALLAGSIFVKRRNFSLRFMMICVFAIGVLGMIPGKMVKPLPARMSMRCIFGKAIPVDQFHQIDQIERAMNPVLALGTLPDLMQEELQLSGHTHIGEVSVNLVSSRSSEIAQGATLKISFAPQITPAQRGALTEFYCYYFEQLCFEFAKANGAINDTTTTRPTVSGRFYKYLNQWEAKRAESLPAPEATPAR